MNLTKSTIEETLRNRLFGSPLFPAARTAYQSVFNRGKLNNRRKMRSFYSQFIHSGDLVFDVGANVGVYTEIFSELGAEVVAVEPNPFCCRLLQRFAQNRNVTIEPRAAGETPGKIALHLSDNHQLSSVSLDWLEAARQSSLHANSHWHGEIEVEVTTLDRLAERYGVPAFVKIDVEGFDDHVVRGMSFKPATLTFEFNRLLPDAADRCLKAPTMSSDYEFNFVHGGKMQCVAPVWSMAEPFGKSLDTLAAKEQSGDVIARRIFRR
jgi:FkbM family methyltransferase